MIISFVFLISILIFLSIVTYSLSEENNRYYLLSVTLGIITFIVIIFLLLHIEESYRYVLGECIYLGGCDNNNKIVGCLKVESIELKDIYNNMAR